MMPDWVIPTLPHLEAEVRARVTASGQPIRVVVGEAEKLAAFRRARAALAASGTVTLELALAQIPTVAAYRVANWEAFIARRLITASSAILPNLVLGERLVRNSSRRRWARKPSRHACSSCFRRARRASGSLPASGKSRPG